MYTQFFTPRSQLGSAGKDSLVALPAKSELYGGKGKDILVAVGKRDYLHGGSAADVFTVKPSRSLKRKTTHELADFTPSEGDTLDLSAILNDKDKFNFIGRKDFSGDSANSPEVRLINLDTLSSSKSERRPEENYRESKVLSAEVKNAMKTEIGEIPAISDYKSRRFKQVLQIDVDGDKISDYDLILGKKITKADRKSLRLMNDESFITTSMPLRKMPNCSVTQTGIPMLGVDHKFVYKPIIEVVVGNEVQSPSIGCPYMVIGEFGAEIPITTRMGGKVGIKTGTLVGSSSLPETACGYSKDIPLKPPLTGSVGINVGLSAAIEVTDEEATNKEVGLELGVKSGTTINIADGANAFKDSFVTPFAETYAEPKDFNGEGIDVSITLRPYVEMLIGLGAKVPGKDVCTANLIQGDLSLSTPLTTTFTDLRDPSLTLGATINLNANVLRVDCGPISLITKQFPVAEFDIMEAATGESSLILAGENGIIS